MANYSYVLSQLVTFLTIPCFFVVILFKLLFTNDITQKMSMCNPFIYFHIQLIFRLFKLLIYQLFFSFNYYDLTAQF